MPLCGGFVNTRFAFSLIWVQMHGQQIHSERHTEISGARIISRKALTDKTAGMSSVVLLLIFCCFALEGETRMVNPAAKGGIAL